MKIGILKKEDEKVWDEYVLKHSHSTFYHQIGYREIVKHTFGHQPIYLIARKQAGVAGILPLFEIKSRFFPSCLVSLPYCGYGGALADDPEIGRLLVARAIALYQTKNLDYLMIREMQAKQSNARPRATLLLDLTGGEEAIRQRVGSKTRNLISKAKKNNLKVKLGPNQVDNFYRVWSENRRDLGTPAIKKDFFVNLIKDFPQNINILTIMLHHQPLAGMLLVGFRKNLEGLYAGSPKRFRKYLPNMFLYWQAFLSGHRSGYENFDFSPSLVDTHHFRFKEQFGGRKVAVEYRIFSRSRVDLSPTELKSSPKYRLLRRVWQRLPLSVVNLIGPYLAKDIP